MQMQRTMAAPPITNTPIGENIALPPGPSDGHEGMAIQHTHQRGIPHPEGSRCTGGKTRPVEDEVNGFRDRYRLLASDSPARRPAPTVAAGGSLVAALSAARLSASSGSRRTLVDHRQQQQDMCKRRG